MLIDFLITNISSLIRQRGQFDLHILHIQLLQFFRSMKGYNSHLFTHVVSLSNQSSKHRAKPIKRLPWLKTVYCEIKQTRACQNSCSKHTEHTVTFCVDLIQWIWWPIWSWKLWLCPWSCKDQSAHPLASKSIHSPGRGSQHLANSKIPEVQKATLSRGTCNPFIQWYVFIFWILCVTYTVLVCFVSFSVSAQTSLFILFKQSETLWFG